MSFPRRKIVFSSKLPRSHPWRQIDRKNNRKIKPHSCVRFSYLNKAWIS
ncbi:hypothetical protein Patl1_33479 [Pistacia atlantica]|uniref:Uncharacterized protein n=1 Tax=Pistacia atlantica TaxID=434234 RepID=A0ACC0ZWN9_9ROSI|nr:hypothetical protein Patl1_33479 [Pistacia atlantica]